MSKTLVIGAGMAGLACARALVAAGHPVTVLDKGRGIGGRLATRRTEEGWQFDHGAPHISAEGAAFGAVLADFQASGALAPWTDDNHLVGVPGMSAFAKAMAEGIEIHQRIKVRAIHRDKDAFVLDLGDRHLSAARVVVTVPAPQAARLLGEAHPLTGHLAEVSYAPALSLMAVFPAEAPAPPFHHRGDAAGDLAWIGCNSTKPGRPGPGCWVAEASTGWSRQHLERDRAEIAEMMAPLLCAELGARPDALCHIAGHRWRYAHVTDPLGAPFLCEDGLYLGGDWCLGSRVEHAWQSGIAIARDILGAS